jgi:thioredoxin reductase (NADPH)
MKEEKIYETIIIGAGPAGLTAGLYAQRMGLLTLVLEDLTTPSQLLMTDRVENYPGFPEGVKGNILWEKFRTQLKEVGGKIEEGRVRAIEKEEWGWVVKTAEKDFKANTVIVATGAQPKKLGVPGEEEFLGRGVSYCAVCEGPLFKDKNIVVVGGGNTAVEEALFLSKWGKKIFLIHRRSQLRADQYLIGQLKKEEKIQFIGETVVVEILGGENVEKIRVRNLSNYQEKQINCSAVFIAVGQTPNTAFSGFILEIDEEGFILTDEEMRTSQPGIFAAGDCRKKALAQIITACSDGARAAFSCQKFLSRKVQR